MSHNQTEVRYDTLGRKTYIFAGNSRVAMKSGTTVLFCHPDHQGGTSVVTDAAGNKVEAVAYYPFGETRQDSGTDATLYKWSLTAR